MFLPGYLRHIGQCFFYEDVEYRNHIFDGIEFKDVSNILRRGSLNSFFFQGSLLAVSIGRSSVLRFFFRHGPNTVTVVLVTWLKFNIHYPFTSLIV